MNKDLARRNEQLSQDNDQHFSTIQNLEEKLASHENEICELKKRLSDEKKAGKDLNKDLDDNLKVNFRQMEKLSGCTDKVISHRIPLCKCL